MSLAGAVALTLASAACNQGNSGNVMAPDPNALDPAQVDAALGSEVVNGGDNEAAPADGAELPDDTTDAAEPANAAEPAADDTAEEAPAENVSGEQ